MFRPRCARHRPDNNPLPQEIAPDDKTVHPLSLNLLRSPPLLSASAMAADDASCKAVRMGVVNWTDVIATSGMAEVLLNGLGYESKQTSAVQQIIFAGIRDKRLDIFLGYWKPAMDKNIAPFVAANQVKVIRQAKPGRRPGNPGRAEYVARRAENLRRHRQIQGQARRQDLRHRAWQRRQHHIKTMIENQSLRPRRTSS
jgi:glycine betaine/proline transport system substrate-binding protein